MILTALALITATPATLPAALVAAAPGDRIVLTAGDYGPVVIKGRAFSPGIFIDARKANNVAGINFERSAGIRWLGATVRAPAGINGFAAGGYGVRLVESSDIIIQGATITDARKGLVLGGGRNVAIRNNKFTGLREDGIIATRTEKLAISRNSFDNFQPFPTTCTIGAEIIRGLSRAICQGRGGVWRDGNHPDAIQIYDGITNAIVNDNVISGAMQGIGQMGNSSSAPMVAVTIRGNSVQTAYYHSISMFACNRCRVTDNIIQPNLTPGRQSPIRFTPPGTIACGNTGIAGAGASKPC